jgi:hypothetical protein
MTVCDMYYGYLRRESSIVTTLRRWPTPPTQWSLTRDIIAATEHRGRVFSTPASYSGGPGLKSRP